MPQFGAPVPPTAAMGIFPLVVVVAFGAPLSKLLHLVALGRLRKEARVGAGQDRTLRAAGRAV